MRIVIADDDPSVLALVRTTLELDRHEVHAAADGREALELVDALAPDLVVLDVMMPRLDGWTVVATLRRDERFARTPLLVLTARGLPQDVQTGREAGASATLAKPFEPQDLSDMVAALGAVRR